tara:strand:- start:44 stop:721 length:678 start_codon:yes stop_codon:yes gene_type:complete
MIELRYPTISAGYIGAHSNHQTLNSTFYGLLQRDFNNLPTRDNDGILLIPQRIPRSGLFHELYRLETSFYKNEFRSKIREISKRLKSGIRISSPSKKENATRSYINWANLALRHGQFRAVINNAPFTTTSHELSLELQLLHEIAKSELNLSRRLPINADAYHALADHHLPANLASEREKLMLLNQLIVTTCRYQDKSTHIKIITHAKDYLSRLEKFESKNPLNQI